MWLVGICPLVSVSSPHPIPPTAAGKSRRNEVPPRAAVSRHVSASAGQDPLPLGMGIPGMRW